MPLFQYIIGLFLGAFCIADAVYAFSRKHYFVFGLDVMLAITCAALMIKMLLMN